MAQIGASDKRNPSEQTYDAIVIGSGMGALAFASIMAKLRKWRVLVLERHFKIGGFTHTFSRPGGWTWDVGVHYVGEMGHGMNGRRLFLSNFLLERHRGRSTDTRRRRTDFEKRGLRPRRRSGTYTSPARMRECSESWAP